MVNRGDRLLGDASTIKALVANLAEKIAANRSAQAPLRLIGVRTRGVPLAERLATELRGRSGTEVPVGAVDITLYRDDLGRSQTWPVLHGTEIPFTIDGADVVLVDDVLFTGRTIRAALNAICDLGRPASVRLAVLVDRGHRELPIRADFVGLEVKTDRVDHVRVQLRPVDPVDEIVADGTGVDAAPPAPSAPDVARAQP